MKKVAYEKFRESWQIHHRGQYKLLNTYNVLSIRDAYNPLYLTLPLCSLWYPNPKLMSSINFISRKKKPELLYHPTGWEFQLLKHFGHIIPVRMWSYSMRNKALWKTCWHSGSHWVILSPIMFPNFYCLLDFE